MGMDKPAFPASLPSRSQLLAAPPRYVAPASGKESSGTVKILIAFLSVAILGNIGLTLYLNQARGSVAATEESVRDAKMIDEVAHLRDEITRLRSVVVSGQTEISRLKVQYATVVAQVATTSAPHPNPYAVSSPPSAPTAASQPAATVSDRDGGKLK